MLKMTKVLVCFTLICLCSGAANASVIYNFQAFSSYDDGIGNINGSFQLTVPSFITTNAAFTPSQLDSGNINGNPGLTLGDVGFNPNAFGNNAYDMISFGGTAGINTVSMYYYFDLGAFSKVGTYDTIEFGTDQAARLVVSNTDTTVPEPCTFFLLGVGLGGLGFWRRKKRQ
jgi:hypothetical protein